MARRKKTILEILDEQLEKLVLKSKKTKADYEEIKQLTITRKELNKQKAEIIRAENSGSGRNKLEKETKRKKNDISHVDFDNLEIPDIFFKYQREFIEDRHRWSMWLKPRQAGITYAAAWKIIMLMGSKKGNDCTFISASKAQAFQVRDYISQLCETYLDVDINDRGEEIRFEKNGKTWSKCKFRGANAATGQSYSSHLFIDEFFWIPGYEAVERAARGIATHSKWTKTYFSAPSFATHPAYKHWMPEKKEDFKLGAVSKGIFRKKIDIFECMDQGLNTLINLDEIKEECTEDEFDQLYGCNFVDDTDSVFKWADIERCMVDPDTWDWDEFYIQETWSGTDPALTKDDCAWVHTAPPTDNHAAYITFNTKTWKQTHSEAIVADTADETKNYNLTQWAYDKNGLGHAFETPIKKVFPRVTDLWYSEGLKAELVGKARDIINKNMWQFSNKNTALANAMARIKKKTNPTGTGVTFYSDRTKGAGGDHADLGWAFLNSINWHEYAGNSGSNKPRLKVG